MSIKKICLLLISFLTFSYPVFSQNTDIADIGKLKGSSLTEYLTKTLDYNGYKYKTMSLFRSDNTNFPKNIIMSFPASQKFVPTVEETPATTLIFSFMQEDIAVRTDFLFEIIDYIQVHKFNFDIEILITACDASPLSGNEEASGSAIYSNLFKGRNSVAAVCADFSSVYRNRITPGSGQILSPLWLVKDTVQSLEACGISFKIKGGIFCSLYSHDILKSDNRLATYLSNGINAVDISFKKDILDNYRLSKFFTDFLSNYKPEKSVNLDTHYIPWKLFGKTYFVPEIATLFLMYLTTAVSLFLLCDFGYFFTSHKNAKNAKQSQILRSFWILPLTILAGCISLLAGQSISSALFQTKIYNPVVLFSVKLLVCLFFNTLFFMLFLKFKPNNQIFTFDYLLTTSSILNVFVFSAIDISLFYIFAIAWIIVHFSITAKKIYQCLIYFFVMIFQFLPVLITIALNSSPSQLYPLIFSSPFGIISLSFAITPITLMWFKIILKLQSNAAEERLIKQQNLNITQKARKLFPHYYGFVIICCITVFLSVIVFLSLQIKHTIIKNDNTFKIQKITDSPDNSDISVHYSDSLYYSGSFRTIYINSLKEAVRIEVIVSGQTENPIYYSAHSFSPYANAYQAKFNIPDYPPKNFALIYTPDISDITTIEVNAWYLSEQSTEREKIFDRQKSIILIDKTQAGGL